MRYDDAMTAALAEPRLLTTDDVDAMGDATHGYELVEGKLVERSSSMIGAFCSARVATHIGLYLRQNPIGRIVGSESMYRLGVKSPRTGRKPDASVLLLDQLPYGKIPDTTFHGRPTLAFESVSPGDEADEVERKLMEYVAAGVPLIWVLYPQLRTGRAVSTDGSTKFLSESDAFDGGDALPGLSVPLATILPPAERTNPPPEAAE